MSDADNEQEALARRLEALEDRVRKLRLAVLLLGAFCVLLFIGLLQVREAIDAIVAVLVVVPLVIAAVAFVPVTTWILRRTDAARPSGNRDASAS